MATSPPTTARTPRGQGDLLRDRLIESALAMLDEHGDESQISIRAVTRRTGVSPTAFYLHFEHRDALLQVCFTRCFEEFRDAVRFGAAHSPNPRERLKHAGLAYIEFARERPERYAMIFGVSRLKHPTGEYYDKPPAADEAFNDLVALVQGHLDRQMPEKEVDLLARGVWTGLHGYVTLSHSRQGMRWPSDEDFLTSITRAWLDDPPDPAR